MTSVQQMSTAQLEKFEQFTKGTATGNEAGATEQIYLDHVQTNSANPNDAAGNNRRVQPLNDRVLVWKNKDTTENSVENIEEDAASAVMATAFTAAAVALLSF